MYCHLRRAAPAVAERLRAEPALVAPFMFGHEPDPAPGAGGLFGFLRRLWSGKEDATAASPAAPPAAPAWPPAADGEELDLEKDWHGLHFLLTGAADEVEGVAGFLVGGGEDVGEDRWGDPVARLLAPGPVRDAAALLGALDRDELVRRFDPARMTALEIYPRGAWDPAGTDLRPHLDDLLGSFVELRTFMDAAASAGDAVVVHVG